MAKIFKALVIDDEKGRNPTYERILGEHFLVTIVNSVGDIPDSSYYHEFDLLVLDMYPYSTEISDSSTALSMISQNHISAPVILISSKWTREDGTINSSFLNAMNYPNIRYIYTYAEFADKKKAAGARIFKEFCHYKNYLLDNRKDKISILMMSDLQFGGGESEYDTGTDQLILNKLHDLKINPDMIVITGDVADKGLTEEYIEAKKWLTNFIGSLWRNGEPLTTNDLKRIIIVPGNHDYDLLTCASDEFSYNFKDKTKGFEKKSAEIEYKRQKLGFQNFVDFMADFYQDNDLFHYMKSAVHINNMFLNFGIRFISINTAYKVNIKNFSNAQDGYLKDMKDIVKGEFIVTDSVPENICNVVVMHNPPQMFNREGASYKKLETLLDLQHANVCLSGHTHDNTKTSYVQGSGEYTQSLLSIQAGTLRLAPDSRSEDSLRNFVVAEFNRRDGKIVSVYPRYFELSKTSVTEKSEEMNSIKVIHPDGKKPFEI